MLAGTLAFMAGIYCLMQFASLPSLWLLVLLPVTFFLSRSFSIFRFGLYICLGFCWALLFSHIKLNQQLAPEIENTDVLIEGVITSIPELYDEHVRFLIDIEEITDLEGKMYPSPGIARISWYKQRQIPVPGEKWQLKVKLKRVYGFMNPGGFDYEGWMLRQGIRSTGYVKSYQYNKKTGEDHRYFIQELRHTIAQQLIQSLDKPLLGLVLALTLGERSQLEAEQWQVFSRTGTSHLIAISGLHLSLIAGFVYFLARFVWSRFYFLTQRVPAPIFAAVMAFVGALVYALLAGFALPTQRALIMIAVFMIAIFRIRQSIFVHAICLAAILVLVLDPFAIMAVDFYLSFIAVLLILYITRFRINKHHNFNRWVYLQCLLSFALFPVLIFWFKQIPLYSVFTNLIAIPIIGFLIVPLTLIALFMLFILPQVSQHLYMIVYKIYDFVWSGLSFLSEQNIAVIPIAAPNLFSLLLAIVGVLILLMPRGLPGRYLGLLFFLPLLFPINEKLKQGEFDFNLLDVGQGLAAVIQTKEHTLVYDTGARFSERFNIGEAVLKPYLRQNGISDISMLLISHGDNDHIGGAKAIIDNFTIKHILSSVPEKFPRYNSERCHADQNWDWDGVHFQILHPGKDSKLSGNNASCVLKVSSKFGVVLLTGDVEKEAEINMSNQYKGNLNADILLVPHHGSKTSSTARFISEVSPDYAFFPAGYSNRFGFPKQDIMSRYHANDIKTLVSYETGELSAKFRTNGLQIDEFRTKNRRFWHH